MQPRTASCRKSLALMACVAREISALPSGSSDSLLEEAGFEPSAPPVNELVSPTGTRMGTRHQGRSRRRRLCSGDQGFESAFLQRRVCLTGAFHGYRRKGPAFAGSVSLDETRERDVLATSRLALAAFL
jgi:hypothetical protein